VNVLLLNPPLRSSNPAESLPFPLGLGYLASVLRQAGHEAWILDGCLGPVRKLEAGLYHVGMTAAEMAAEAVRLGPDLVGISVPFTSRMAAALELGREVRRALPGVPLVAGGMHATVEPGELLAAGFDAVLLGEAEISLPLFLEGRLNDGIARARDGRVVEIPQAAHPPDLDALPFPARDRLVRGSFEDYLKRGGGRWIRRGVRVASLITSRGCPYRCTFCSAYRVTGRKYRRRSAANVLDEIADLTAHHRVEVLAFEDDNLTADRARAAEIFEGIARRFPRLQWMTPNGVSLKHLDPELLALMKRSGCRSVNLAFESGDPEMLRVMRKDLDLEQARRVRQWCREAGIAANGYFIIGMPGETPESLRRSMDYAVSLDLDGLGVFIATPFPGTELYDLCREKGYLVSAGQRFEADPEVLHRPLIETPWLKAADLPAWQAEFERRFRHSYYRRRPAVRLRRLAASTLRRLGVRV